MKTIKKIIFMLVLGSVVTSCKKDNIEMVSLNKAGEEHYFGEKVLMWASTEGEKDGIVYEWSATGGAFQGVRTQNLFENMWIAPAEQGQYEVSATAKQGKESSTRTTVMNVSRYFFDNFQSRYTFTGNGWSQSNVLGGNNAILLDSDNPLLSSIELSSNRTNNSNTDANIRRLLNLAELKIPFSVRTKLGYKDFFKAGGPITISLYFAQPNTNPSRPFIREIRWLINPVAATGNNYQIRYETYVPATGTGTFSGNTGTFPSPVPLTNPSGGFTSNSGRNPALFFTDGVAKNLTFSIDEDNVFITHIDGVEWFRSDGIKTWLEQARATWPDFEAPVAREFRIAFPGRTANNAPRTTVFVNSVYINNDGTILNTPQ